MNPETPPGIAGSSGLPVGLDAAPSYQPAASAEQACGSCKFFKAEGGVCTRYGFSAESGFTCGSWTPDDGAPKTIPAAVRNALPTAQEKPISEAPLMIEKEAELRGMRLAHAFLNELERIEATQVVKIAMGVGLDPAADGGMQQSEDAPENEDEAAPAHGVVGTKIEQYGPKQARGIPMILPPPGYIYDQELAAFVPDPNNPGWMQAEQAMEAARNKAFYDQGHMDETVNRAQEEQDAQVDAQAQEMQMAGQAQQQDAAQFGEMKGQATQKALNTAAKQTYVDGQPAPGMSMAAPPTPAGIAGPSPAAPPKKPTVKRPEAKKAPTKKPEAKAGGGKGIKIEIGR